MKPRRTIYPYNPKLKELARQLRNNSTFAEVLLWNELKNKQIKGYDFHRQKPILNYILDFFCSELYLAIEVDGITHDNEVRMIKDSKRQNEIEALGISFLRFSDEDIKTQMEGVVKEIERYIERFELEYKVL
jgi:very-short-patch-repair endonuclease